MRKRATLKDVAELSGVSTTTVSHVVNGTRFVDPTTAARVQSAISELNYVNNHWAKMLKSDRSNIIGLCITNYENPYERHITFYAQKIVQECGYQLHISVFQDNMEDNYKSIQNLLSLRVDGVIAPLTPIFLNPQLLNLCEKLGAPIVCAPATLDWDCIDTVDTNHEEVAYETIRLMTQKHRRIGFISGVPEFSTSIDRLNGYKRALEEAGIPYNEDYVACGNSSIQGGYEAAKQLLQTDVTAIFAANNSMMHGTIQAINETDVSIYDRIALVGFDDEDWYPLMRPSITAIRQPLEEIIRKSVELLLDKIEHPDRPSKHITIPSELIRRESF